MDWTGVLIGVIAGAIGALLLARLWQKLYRALIVLLALIVMLVLALATLQANVSTTVATVGQTFSTIGMVLLSLVVLLLGGMVVVFWLQSRGLKLSKNGRPGRQSTDDSRQLLDTLVMNQALLTHLLLQERHAQLRTARPLPGSSFSALPGDEGDDVDYEDEDPADSGFPPKGWW